MSSSSSSSSSTSLSFSSQGAEPVDPTQKRTTSPQVRPSACCTGIPAADPPHEHRGSPGSVCTLSDLTKKSGSPGCVKPWFLSFLQSPNVSSRPLPYSGDADPTPFSRNLLIPTLTLLPHISIPCRDSRTLTSLLFKFHMRIDPSRTGVTRFAGGQVYITGLLVLVEDQVDRKVWQNCLSKSIL